MNCEQAQTILIDSGVDQKSTTWPQTASLKAAIDHISHCKDCQVDAQFERQLGAWHNVPVQPKSDVWNRIETETSDPALKLWRNPINQKEKMKRNIITSSVAAATIMVGLGLISQSALAATPKAKFIAMKKVVFASVKQGALKQEVGVSWFIVDGQLVNLAEDTIQFKIDPKATSNQVKPDAKWTGKAVGKQGVVPPQPLRLDLNETHYDSIRFGKDQNELVLTQKGQSNTRYVVKLDKKTCAPTYLTLQRSERGQWEQIQGKQVTFIDYLPLK